MCSTDSADAVIAKWDAWLRESEDDLITVAWNRAIYRQLGEIGEANPDIPESAFFEFLGEAYATSQTVAIRRQADLDRNSVSFARLLEVIGRRNPTPLTRDRYLAHFNDDHAREWGEEHWSARWAGQVGHNIDPAIVASDLANLLAAVDPIRVYVNRHVAHRDRRRSAPPTFADVDRAIDAFEALVGAYGDLIRGPASADSSPRRSTTGWRRSGCRGYPAPRLVRLMDHGRVPVDAGSAACSGSSIFVLPSFRYRWRPMFRSKEFRLQRYKQ